MKKLKQEISKVLNLPFGIFIAHLLALYILLSFFENIWTNNFGALLTGLAATGSFWLALIKLGPELKKYLDDKDKDRKIKESEMNFKRGEKISAVAERLALATRAFIGATDYVTSPFVLDGDGVDSDSEHYKNLETTLVRRKKVIGEVLIEFEKAYEVAELYLPDNINNQVKEILKSWNATIAAYKEHIMHLKIGNTRSKENQDAWGRVFSVEARKKREQQQKDLIELLRPMANNFNKNSI